MATATALLLFAGVQASAQHDKPSEKAPTFSVLSVFPEGTDGLYPGPPTSTSPLAVDREGNLYGTTPAGGDLSNPICGIDCGAVFKVDRDGRESVIYTFTGGPTDSKQPSSVIRDEEGNLYGTAYHLIFKISPWGHETDLYDFTGKSDGGDRSIYDERLGGLIRDREGNLYGVAPGGGLENGCTEYQTPYKYNFPPLPGVGCGVVFRIDPRGRETVLYTFTGGADGGIPSGALVRDEEGNLYGTTLEGGDFSSLTCPTYKNGCGVIFKVDRHGKETVLHTFDAVAGIYAPNPTGLTRDRDGTLYGTTTNGGSNGEGVVYKLAVSGEYTVLHNFNYFVSDGMSPLAPPTLIGGDIYGATPSGGETPGFPGVGVIYKIDQSGNETVLYRFKGNDDGEVPANQLTPDENGNLYGTTVGGGDLQATGCTLGCGVVYKVDLHQKCDDHHRHHNAWHGPLARHDDCEN